MLLGHGFIDPREARADRQVQVQPACEDWGFEGHSLGFQAAYTPGPVTMTHVIQDHIDTHNIDLSEVKMRVDMIQEDWVERGLLKLKDQEKG